MTIVEEAHKAVETINDVISCNLYEDNFIPEKFVERLRDVSHHYMLEFMSNGDACLIEFMGIQVWNSEDDEREYDDDKDDFAESIDKFVFNEMNKILSIDLRIIERALNK